MNGLSGRDVTDFGSKIVMVSLILTLRVAALERRKENGISDSKRKYRGNKLLMRKKRF